MKNDNFSRGLAWILTFIMVFSLAPMLWEEAIDRAFAVEEYNYTKEELVYDSVLSSKD